MVNWRAIPVLLAVAAVRPVQAADEARTAPLVEPYASLLRDPRVLSSVSTTQQDLSVWPPKPPEAMPPPPPQPAPPVYQPNNFQPPAGPVPTVTAVVPALPAVPLFVQSTWYTRFDYFHWNERFEGADFVNEDGPLFTIGYQRRVGQERFRAELFGSQVHYAATLVFDDGTTEPLSSRTDYLGARAEYDFLFSPSWQSPVDYFAGIGTRFWIRNLPDMVTGAGDFVRGYQETWWTIYPYLGLETRRDPRRDIEWYGRGRIGLVAITYERVELNDTTLFPGPGVTGQMELGVRGDHLFLAGFFEAFTFRQSHEARDLVQPSSLLLTVGLKTGFSF
ncbi:MAG: hypothetical protein HYX69_10750 [Planctomycetia bacterium]|nr:hypothetical protein [Planctomycetia bacterium]